MLGLGDWKGGASPAVSRWTFGPDGGKVLLPCRFGKDGRAESTEIAPPTVSRWLNTRTPILPDPRTTTRVAALVLAVSAGGCSANQRAWPCLHSLRPPRGQNVECLPQKHKPPLCPALNSLPTEYEIARSTTSQRFTMTAVCPTRESSCCAAGSPGASRSVCSHSATASPSRPLSLRAYPRLR
jgi:hypothetical protein